MTTKKEEKNRKRFYIHKIVCSCYPQTNNQHKLSLRPDWQLTMLYKFCPRNGQVEIFVLFTGKNAEHFDWLLNINYTYK